MPGYAKRIDKNHPAIRELARKMGYKWHDTFRQGPLDAIICDGPLGTRNVWVEIKDGNLPLTETEQKFWDTWPGEKVKVISEEHFIVLDAIWKNGVKKQCPDNTGK